MSTEKSAIEALIAQALALSDDDDARLEPVRALHGTRGREVFEAAARLCAAALPAERRLGADILGQLGWAEDRPYLEQTLSVLIALCEHEHDVTVLDSAAVALGHIGDRRGLPSLLRLVGHENASLRQSVAFALPSVLGSDPSADDAGITALIALTADTDDDVRSWATFGLGSQVDVDTPAVRSALADRVDDDDRDVAGEALVGLAKRADPRAAQAVKRRLDDFDADTFVLEAVSELRDPSLRPLLIALQHSGWAETPGEETALQAAIDGLAAPSPSGPEPGLSE